MSQTPRTAMLLSVAVVMLASSCGSESATPTGSTESSGSPTASEPSGPTSSAAPSAAPAPTLTRSPSRPRKSSRAQGIALTSGSSDYGSMVFGADQRAVYIWEVEDSSKPRCYGDCAEAWPPVLSDGPPVAQGRVDADLLSTTRRRDGSTQVTYNGHPLYYYAHEGPGEVRCHNVATHGGLWWVVRPDGNRAP